MANPASYPENGPQRLFLERSPEAREYDQQDWPGSSSFHPPHLRHLFKDPLQVAEETPVTDELRGDEPPHDQSE